MKKSRFKLTILTLILFSGFIYSCGQQGGKGGDEKKIQDDLKLDEIPAVVMDALKERFPEAEIQKWTREKEEDFVIYDFEFEQAGRKFEADIKEDGSIYNWEQAIQAGDLPTVVTEAIREKYPEAIFKEVMEITGIEGKDEKVEEYEVIIETADGREVEVTLSPEGRILEDSTGENPEDAKY